MDTQMVEEPLELPPAIEEGDDSEAGGGKSVETVREDELEDADELDEHDVEDRYR